MKNMIELARLTIGVKLPASFTPTLQELQTTIRRKAIVDMRWVAPTEFILPLLILGEVSPGVLPRLEASLSEFCAKAPPIHLVVKGLVGLPNQVQPRYACVGIEGDVAGFETFHSRLVETLRPVIQLPEGRLYQPMINLGRLRQESEQSRVALGRGMRVIQCPEIGVLEMDHVDLLKATAAEGVSSELIKSFQMASNSYQP